MIAEIDRAREAGDTMGGSFEVIAHGVPPGLGSYVHWDRKLDGRSGPGAACRFPAIKAVGIGRGPLVRPFRARGCTTRSFRAISATAPVPLGVRRPTNNAGGLEGGVTNGEDLRVTGYMKPISTLMKPLRSVDLATHDRKPAATVELQRRLGRPRRGGRRRGDGRHRAGGCASSKNLAATPSRTSLATGSVLRSCVRPVAR